MYSRGQTCRAAPARCASTSTDTCELQLRSNGLDTGGRLGVHRQNRLYYQASLFIQWPTGAACWPENRPALQDIRSE